MRHLTFISLAIGSVLTIGGCAQGTGDGLGHADARPNSFIDANLNGPDAYQWPDAPVALPDAFVNQPADANISVPDAFGGGGGGTCTTSAQCTDPASPCCIDLTGSGSGICFADPGLPGFCL